MTNATPQPALELPLNQEITGDDLGAATTTKITLVGRPGKIIERNGSIMTMMESTKVPSLPKGLSAPADTPTRYTVHISAKQWKKVEEAIKDPEDALIIEGFPGTNGELSAIAVFTTNVTTKKLQAELRQAKAAPA
jgi:hypothetical protein